MSIHLLHIRASILLFATVCIASLTAAWPAQTPFPINAEEMLALAKDITHDKYPEADTALVDDMQYVQYEADGTHIVWDDMAYKILTEKGKAQMKTQSLRYNVSYGKAAFEFIHVHKPDGKCAELPLDKLVREMVDPSQMNANIYNPNDKVITANLPDLEIGDVIRFRTRHETTKPRCPNTFSDWFILESDDFIRRYTIVVDGPAELPLRKIALRNPVGNTVASAVETLPSGRIRHRWTAQNVPVMHPEPKMPSISTVAQRVMVSTIDSWNDVSKWYWKLCQPHMSATPEMQAKVTDLTRGAVNQLDAIRQIFRFVSQEIRYMGITIEDEAPGYEPHDVALTFNNRHGVCRDKAALLAAMLNLAGIQAFPVLIKAGDKMDPEIPVPYFNHAITAALAQDGSYILMDSTDENTKDLFPSYLADKSFLVARKDGETLQTSPFSPIKDNMAIIRTKGAIDADGTLTASTHVDFTGINDNAYRGSFAEESPEERKEFIQRVLKSKFPGARLLKLSITPENMLDTTKPVVLDFEYECEDIFVANDAYAMLSTPSLASAFGLNNFILRATSLDRRKYPFKTNFACGVTETLTLDLAARWGQPAASPQYAQIDDDCLRWTCVMAQEGTRFTVQTDSALKKIEYTPEEYLTLKKHLQAMEENADKMFIFRREPAAPVKSAVEPDLEYLEDTVSFSLQSATEWTSTHACKYKILTYKGKKDHAELSFEFFPSRESLVVELARVTNTVKNADGTESLKVLEVSEKEKNLMDAPWVARAPRYPAARKLVVSLPGVEIGSVVEFKVSTTTRSPFPFAHTASFRRLNAPVNRQTLVVNLPVNLKLSTAVFQNGLFADAFQTHENNIAETVTTENNRMIWTWSAQQQPALPDESGMPAKAIFTPTVFCSTGAWQQITADIKNALETRVVPGTRVRQIAADIAKLPENQRLGAVNTFLARNIAIAGPHYQSIPLDKLSLPDTTLSQGYGHAADAAIAAYAILKELGFTPEFILFCSWPQRNDLFKSYVANPSAGLFGGIRVRVVKDGRIFWFNDHNQYANIETTHLDHHYAMTLAGDIFTVAAAPGLADRDDARYDITLHDDGSADITYTRAIVGTDYESYKQRFAQFTPEYRRRFHLALLDQLSAKATATSDLAAQLDTYPGSMSFSCHVPHYAILDGNYLYMKLPVAAFMRMPAKVLENRKAPMACGGFNSFSRKVTVHCPQTFAKVLMAPTNMTWNTSADADYTARYSVETTTAENTITILYQAECMPEIIFPKDFDKYRAIQKTIAHPSTQTIMLGKTASDKR